MYDRYLGVLKRHYPVKKLAPMLAILVALSPFSIDTYLPAIPAMADYFDADIYLIELSLAIYLCGYALGQIVGGPISDNYGRRKIGIIGLSIFCLSSIAIINANTVEQLLLFRFIQAFGGGFGLVIGIAIIRDIYEGKDAAKVFTLVGFIMMIAPLIAPTIGAILLHYFNWQSIFTLLTIYAMVQILVVMLFIPETIKLRKLNGFVHLSFYQVINNYKSILSHRRALPFLLCTGFAAATMFSYLTEASFVYIKYFHISEQFFAWLFGLNVASMMLFNRVNRYLLDLWQPTKILKLGLLLQLNASLVLLISVLLGLENITLTAAMMMVIIGAFGLIAPNNMSCYMHYFPTTSGTANAIIGSSQFIFGAIISLFLSKLHNGTPLPMFGMMLLCSTCAFLSFKSRKL